MRLEKRKSFVGNLGTFLSLLSLVSYYEATFLEPNHSLESALDPTTPEMTRLPHDPVLAALCFSIRAISDQYQSKADWLAGDQKMKSEQLLKEIEELRAKVAELESLQAEMWESQSRYKAIVEAFDGFIYICSPEYEVEFMNSRFIERTGRNPVGEDCYRALHDLEEICWWCVNDRVFAGETVRWEVQSPKDRRWYHVVNTPIRHSDGSVSKMAMIQDVTERKLSETALRESEDRYRQFVESANDIIYRTDSNGCFAFVNPIATRLTGYFGDELIGRDYLELVHPEARNEVARFYGIQFVKKLANTYYELPLLAKGGKTVWVGQQVQLLLENDVPVGFQAIARDITDRKHAEQELEQERLRFRTLAEQAPYAMAMISAGGRFLYANPKFEEMFGYDLSEIPMGRDWFRKAYPNKEYRHGVIAAWLEDCSRSGFGEQRPRVFTVTCKDGQEKIVHFRPVQLPTGEHLMTCEDITDRVRFERTLSEHVSMLESILDKAADGICVCHNVEEFPYVRFTHWNPRMLEITGYTMGEINQSGWYQTMYPDPDTQMRAVERMQRMRLGDDIRAEEWVITSKDGTQRPLSISTSVIKEEDGMIHVLAIIQDITDRKRAEESLRQSERRFQLFMHHLPGLAYIKDGDGRILFANSGFSRYLGIDESVLVGKTNYDVFPAEFADKITTDDRRILESGECEEIEEFYGNLIWSTIKFPILEAGEQPILGGLTIDITDRKKAQEAFRESEDRFRLAFQTSPDAVNINRLSDGLYVDINEGFSEMTGFTRDEVLAKSSLEINIWHDPKDRKRLVAALNETGYVKNFQAQFRMKDGRVRNGLMSARIIVLRGEPHILSVTRDVHDWKKAEEALRKSEEFNRRMVQHSPMGILYLTSEGVISFTNPACNAIFEVPEDKPSPLIHLNIFQLPLIADQPHVRAHFEELIREGKPQRDIELEYLSPVTGKDYTLLASATPRPAADGTIAGSVVMITDITERKRAEQQLQRLYAAVEQAAETIVVTDPAGTILYVNPAFERTTGYKVDEAIGQNPRILKSGHQDKVFYEAFWADISSGQVWRGEFTNRKKDGTLYQEIATISSIKDQEGRIVNYVAVKRDITGEAMLQKQLVQAQKMEAIGTLAGGIAHDFNNLLQAILGYSDLLLLKKGLQDPDRRKLEAIKHAARDGADLVSRILTFSRRAESKVRPLDLNDEIRRVEQLLQRTLPKMIRIELALADDLRIIDADPGQIEQVLFNLAVNAHHAMPDGGQLLIETRNVSLSDTYLRAHLGAKAGKYVLLTVSDTGVGMTPEVLDRVFEPFYTTKANGEGTGLGLAIVHGIVGQHSGYIRCYSEPGRGTSFKIYFPVSACELIPDLTMTRQMPAFGTETILLVDDDDRIREMGVQMIGMGGYQVIAARNGEEALEIYARRREEISLVILDLIMPGMGGYRCLQKLLRVDPDARVLLASGYSDNGLTVGDKGTGARGFVRKPYDAKDILIAIRKVLDSGRL